jgi:hypothetical protein
MRIEGLTQSDVHRLLGLAIVPHKRRERIKDLFTLCWALRLLCQFISDEADTVGLRQYFTRLFKSAEAAVIIDSVCLCGSARFRWNEYVTLDHSHHCSALPLMTAAIQANSDEEEDDDDDDEVVILPSPSSSRAPVPAPPRVAHVEVPPAPPRKRARQAAPAVVTPPSIQDQLDCMTNTEVKPATKDDAIACVVCMEFRREVLFQPCGHLVCCVQCARQTAVDIGCSVCRVKVTSALRAFY